MDTQLPSSEPKKTFFDYPQVQVDNIQIGPGIPVGIERVTNSKVGIGGAFGTWGEPYSNEKLTQLVEDRIGEPLLPEDTLNLSELGFDHRHHLAHLSEEEHFELEVNIGARFLREAATACGWEPSEVQAVLIGSSGPASNDFTERIARQAGIPENALKVSVHKACDGSVGSLNLALNPNLPINARNQINLAEDLYGKKVLVGGIE